MRKFMLLSASALATVGVTPAFAQDAQDEEVVDDNVIIVTASKRETTLQETPIAVSVTDGETIEQAQIRDLNDLQSVVPSLRVNQLQSSANTNFIIRGFGNGANNAGIEPSVGVFIDGVYRSRSAAQIGDLPNVQRIEVLRGPQSTLFGKNASAGVISVVTRKPQFEFGGAVEASYGNFNAIVAKANVTGPISDTVAFSLAGNYNNRDGYIDVVNRNDETNERNRWGVRGDLLFEPNSDFSIRLIGDYDKIDENCCGVVNLLNGPTGGLVSLLAGGVAFQPETPFSYEVLNNFPSVNNIKNYGFSGQVDYSFGALNLTSITAYRRVDSFRNQDVDFGAADLVGGSSEDLNIKTFTQELRLASDFDGPINFLLGGYYFDEKIDQANAIFFGSQFRPYADGLAKGLSGGAIGLSALPAFNAFGPLPMVGLEETLGALDGNPAQYLGAFFRQNDGLVEAYTMDNTAISIFGTVDVEITDRLTVTGGFNYTDDSKDFTLNVVSNDVFSGIDLDAPQYAPFRNQLLLQGALAQGLPLAQAQAFANANDNNPALNPLAGFKAFQFLPPFLNVPNAVENGQTDDNKWTWTVRVAYDVTDTLNAYATWATGYKASSVNLSRDSRPLVADLAAIQAAGIAPVNLSTGSRFAGPEESEVFEIGLKGQFEYAGFNMAVFKQSIKGFQSNIFTGTGFLLGNAGEQSTWGLEFDGFVQPIDPLNLFLNLTYLDPKYDSFVNSAFGDVSGSTPAGISAISMSIGGTYTHEFDSGAQLIGRLDYNYESDVQVADGLPGFITTTNGVRDTTAALAVVRPFRRQVDLLNGALTLKLNNGFEFSIWGRNLLDDQYISTIFDTVAQNGSISGYPSQPRTYGATARFKF